MLFAPRIAYAQTCPPLPTGTGAVILNSTIPSAGSYKVWSRIKPSTTEVNFNSYWLQLGNSCAVKVGDNTTSIPVDSWTWVDFKNGNTADKVIFSLTSGPQVVKLFGNETMVSIDRILILNSSDSCMPSGIGDNYSAIVSVSPTAVFTPTPTTQPSISPSQLPTLTPLPTSTPVPNSTLFNLNLLLHGLGRGGDNSNSTSIGNLNPLHPQKNLILEIYDSSNNLMKSIPSTVTYNSSNGNFTGIFDGGTNISSASYIVKIKGLPYLRKQIGGIITVTDGSTYTLPQTALTTGDVNNDNQLNILDYSLLLDCYSELTQARSCDSAKLLVTDFTDDGSVNQFDYNLF